MAEKKQIWLAGYPSFYGGADTEALHNIDLWRMNDVDINLVPMFGCDPKMRANMDSLGVKTHEYHAGIFKDKILVSYCNGSFLEHLPHIMELGPPKAVVWFNSMTWTFPREIEAHKNGWLNFYGFVSNYQRKWLQPELEKFGPVRALDGYRPYFNTENISQKIQFNYNKPKDWFALGRISRDDMHKYSADMWNIFYKVCTPRHKKVFILGYGANANQKCGKAPDGLDWQTYQPNEVPVRHVYGLLHAIIHKTGGSRESYCRIVPEAYAYGVPMIVERDYAFPDLIQDGVTGYMCNSSDEMSYRASELAFDEEKRKKMIFAARDFLVNDISSAARCWEPWKKLFEEI